MKIGLVYHGVLRWPDGILTQLEQLSSHDVDLFFCLQEDSNTYDIIKKFDYKSAKIYQRPSFSWFCQNLDIRGLNKILNTNWLTYSPYLQGSVGRSFSLLNYHNFNEIAKEFHKKFLDYDLIIVSRSDLRAMFPFDFSCFREDRLYIADYFRCFGYQMIGNWFYGSPEIIIKSLKSIYNTLFEVDFLTKTLKHPHNAECYCKAAIDKNEIKVGEFPLNCFISADSKNVENSGFGQLKYHHKYKFYFKYIGQLNGCLSNLIIQNINE